MASSNIAMRQSELSVHWIGILLDISIRKEEHTKERCSVFRVTERTGGTIYIMQQGQETVQREIGKWILVNSR